MDRRPDPATETPLSVDADDLERALRSAMLRFTHTVDLATVSSGASVAARVTELPPAWVVASRCDQRFEDPSTCVDLPEPRDAERMITDLATSPYALRLYHLELAPGFRSLAAHVAEPVRHLRSEGGVQDVNVALFLAPPGAVTSAHPDRHHNLLLQVAGTKDVWIEDLSSDPVERHRRGVSWFHHPGAGLPELPPAQLVRLGPGDGVYIPPMSFHWTRVTGEEGSIALSVGFATARTVGEQRLSQVDVSLRRLGWRRSRPATSGRRLSRAKGSFVNAIDGARGRSPRILP